MAFARRKAQFLGKSNDWRFRNIKNYMMFDYGGFSTSKQIGWHVSRRKEMTEVQARKH